MENLLRDITSSFYATQLSVGSMIVTVFSVTLAVFFLQPGKKTGTTLHLGMAYAFLALFHGAFFISFSFYHPLAAYHRWLTVPSVLGAALHLTGFILQYPDNKNSKAAGIFSTVMYITLFTCAGIYSFLTWDAGITFRFDGHYYDLNSAAAGRFIGIVILINTCLFFIALLFRLFQLKGAELRRMILVGIPCVAGATLPAVLNLLNLKGYISRESFQIILNMSHLFALLFMALLYLNTTREKFTFMGKIVGISIVTFLAVFILDSHFTLIDMDKNYNTINVQAGRMHIVKPSDDDGVAFMNMCRFPPGISTGHDDDLCDAVLPDNSTEYFNTMVYEEIKMIPDRDFTPRLYSLLDSGDEFFTGYRDIIIDIYRSLPADISGRGPAVCRGIDALNGYITFYYYHLSSLDENGFRAEFNKAASGIMKKLNPFRDAMLSFADGSVLNGAELKKNIIRYIQPMNPSGSRKYRIDNEGRNYTSFIFYDRAEKTVYEAGFMYVSYRKFMHNTASRRILVIISVVFFMIVIYPFFFMGTMYRPLKTLLTGVNRVINGELDFKVEVQIEDEIGEITGTFNKMTAKLRENSEEILRSGNRFRDLADMLPDIIYETDPELNITYLNRAGTFLGGYTKDDIASGLSLEDLVSDRDFRSLRIFSRKCSGIDGAVFSRTHDVFKKDGGIFTGENRAVFIFNEDGVAGLRGIIRDVTEKLRTEEALLQIQKMETIGTLVGGLAHDFNNILAGITGPLSMIQFSMEKNGGIDADDFNVYIETMNESSRRAVDLVQQLVNLSRKDTVALVPLDINLSLKHVVRICRSAFDKSIEIMADIPETPVMVMGDTTQLEQMLLNICINGSHAMTIMRPEGGARGGRLHISIEEISADEHFAAIHPDAREIYYWKISVSDTGVGMDSETMSKIFIPFFTTKERGTGTGLGLAMVYNIVKHHRGIIDVYSVKGTGTTFNVFLPVLGEHEKTGIADAAVRVPAGKGLILVADDEESLRLTARMMLEKCGYDVITAVDGEDALKVYSENEADVSAVLLDLLMPRMSGEVAAAELKKINPEVKILLASGMIHDERAERIASDGKCLFLQKPYTFETLSRAVYNMLNDIKE